jgi:hypothetical protein
MTVDNGEVTDKNAEFTISSSDVALTGTVIFPIGSDGSGTGAFTIPINQTAKTLTITVTDNAAVLNVGTSTLASNNRVITASLKVPSGTVTIEPAAASTGNSITITGSKFPPNTAGTTLTIGGSTAVPASGFKTDANGDFSVITEVPAASGGGSLTPGTKIVEVTIGTIDGSTTGFAVPSPAITLTPASASVEDTVMITGTGFNSLGTVTVLDIGSASALPSPAPRAGRDGTIETTVLIPLLNPGTYLVTMTNATGFSASATFTAVASGTGAASTASNTEDVFADVISNSDNLVRVWRYSNATQSWSFFDPRPEFASANTLLKTGAGDIVWVNVNNQQDFAHAQGTALVPGWNLIVLK